MGKGEREGVEGGREGGGGGGGQMEESFYSHPQTLKQTRERVRYSVHVDT